MLTCAQYCWCHPPKKKAYTFPLVACAVAAISYANADGSAEAKNVALVLALIACVAFFYVLLRTLHVIVMPPVENGDGDGDGTTSCLKGLFPRDAVAAVMLSQHTGGGGGGGSASEDGCFKCFGSSGGGDDAENVVVGVEFTGRGAGGGGGVVSVSV